MMHLLLPLATLLLLGLIGTGLLFLEPPQGSEKLLETIVIALIALAHGNIQKRDRDP
jgi:hypothetical protein